MRILYVCHDLDYWAAHRAGMAAIMAGQGHEVALISGVRPVGGEDAVAGMPARDDRPAAASNRRLEPIAGQHGLIPGGRLWTLPVEPQRLTPGADLRLARAVRAGVAAFRPDVVHLLTLKPVLFGAAALRWARGVRVVATFAGLGRVFAAGRPDLRQRLVARGLRYGFARRNLVAAFENEADRDRLIAAGIIPAERAAVVPGAGFDPTDFPAASLPPGPAEGAPLSLLFASRMLKAKGAVAVIDAARLLKGAPVRFTLAGPAGTDADAFPAELLQAAESEGLIQHLGPVSPDRMAAMIASHHLLLLPTRYPEGTPRILAEAGAVGRGSIVSDHPGCTTFVRDGTDGVVLDRADGPALAAAIRRVLDAPDKVVRMGEAAQRRALGSFTTAHVAAAYLRLYARPAGAS